MPEHPNSLPALRARVNYHEGTLAAAETERARLLALRDRDGAGLPDDSLDEIEAESVHLGVAIERCRSRLDLIRPALAAAVRAEAEAEDRGRSAALAEQDRQSIAAVASQLGGAEASIAAAQLRAAATPVRPVNQKLFDEPPAPVMKRDDGAFWEARERREREDRAARLAVGMGQPAAPHR